MLESPSESEGLPHFHPGVKSIIRKSLNYLYPKEWREFFFIASPELDVENSSLYDLTEALNSYQVLLLLKALFMGPTFWSLANDSNYYQGDEVKTWIDDLLQYLQFSGIKYDRKTSEFYTDNQTLRVELRAIDQAEFLPLKFSTEFYEKLRVEINKCYTYGLANGVLTLSRKLIENMVIHILRSKFPLSGGTANLELYYHNSKGRFKNFSDLIDVLNTKRGEFIPDEKLVDDIVKNISTFRETANATAHSITTYSSLDEVDALNVPKAVSLLDVLLKNNGEKL